MMWTSEMKWLCSNNTKKSVVLKLEKDFLVVKLAESNSKHQRITSKSTAREFSVAIIGDSRIQNRNFRDVAEQILLYLGLPYAEQNEIARQIRVFVCQVL